MWVDLARWQNDSLTADLPQKAAIDYSKRPPSGTAETFIFQDLPRLIGHNLPIAKINCRLAGRGCIDKHCDRQIICKPHAACFSARSEHSISTSHGLRRDLL
jgi:hypothetical protein